MSQNSIKVANPSTGIPVDTSQILIGGTLVNRQRMVISDDEHAEGVSSVLNIDPETDTYALVVRNIPSGIQQSSLKGTQTQKESFISPEGSLKSSNEYHLAGSIFSGSILDTNYWQYTGGASKASINLGTLSLVQSPDTAILNSAHPARYIAYKSNYFKCNMVFDGVLNNGVKRWGAFDTDGGVFFEVSDIVKIVTRLQGNDTVVNHQNFNGSQMILDNNPHIYEIHYSEEQTKFYQDRILIHAIGNFIPALFKLTLRVGLQNIGNTSNSTMIVKSANIFSFEKTEMEPEVFNDNQPNVTKTLKYSTGTLQRIIINTSGDTASWITIYDGLDTTGKKMAKISMSITPTTLVYNFIFYTGLTIETSSQSPGDFTIVYD